MKFANAQLRGRQAVRIGQELFERTLMVQARAGDATCQEKSVWKSLSGARRYVNLFTGTRTGRKSSLSITLEITIPLGAQNIYFYEKQREMTLEDMPPVLLPYAEPGMFCRGRSRCDAPSLMLKIDSCQRFPRSCSHLTQAFHAQYRGLLPCHAFQYRRMVHSRRWVFLDSTEPETTK